jgi:hypothetical protein
MDSCLSPYIWPPPSLYLLEQPSNHQQVSLPERVIGMNFRNDFLSLGLDRLLGSPHLWHTTHKRCSQMRFEKLVKVYQNSKTKLQEGIPI